jgi:hypothetical protein
VPSESRAEDGQVVARVSRLAPVGSGDEGQAFSARIIGSATAWDPHAPALKSAPLKSSIANTLAALVVIQGTFGGNNRAGVGSRTPGGVGLEGQAFSAAVALNTTVGNPDAGSAGLAPRESGIADALTTVVVGARTVGRNGEAGLGLSAPAESGLNGQTVAAVVVSETAIGNVDAGI